MRPISGYSAGVSHRQPGANPAGCDRGAASLWPCGANRFRRDRAFAAAGVSGARRLRRDRDAASPCGFGANLCLRRDPDARAAGAAPLRCAPPAVARLRGQREVEAAGRCLDVVDSDFSLLFQPCMSPIDRHRLVSDVVDGRCTFSPGQVVAPVVCNNKCPWSMTQRSSSMVVNVPVIMRFTSRTWWTFQLATETGFRLSAEAPMVGF